MKNLLIASTLAFASLTSAAQTNSKKPASAQGQEVLTVVAIAKIKAGEEETFKKAANILVTETRKEKGNITFTYAQSTKDPTEFAFTELWKSEEDLKKHFEAPHMKAFFDKVKDRFLPGYPSIGTYKEIKN